MRVHASLAIAIVKLWMSGLYVLRSCRCVYFSEVVSCIHYANASTFIAWFDDNGLIIFEVVQCSFPVMFGYCRFSDNAREKVD